LEHEYVYRAESLASFLRKHDVIKIGPKTERQHFAHCLAMSSTLGVYDIRPR